MTTPTTTLIPSTPAAARGRVLGDLGADRLRALFQWLVDRECSHDVREEEDALWPSSLDVRRRLLAASHHGPFAVERVSWRVGLNRY